MANIKELGQALVNADKAGDTESARVLANEIDKLMKSSSMPKPESEPDLVRDLKVAGSTILEGAPRALGTALGTLVGGTGGTLVTPVAGTVVAGVGGGIAGGYGAEKIADTLTGLTQRYITKNPETTYREAARSLTGIYPTSDREKNIQTAVGTGLDVVSSLGLGSLAKTAGKAAISKAGQTMAAQPLTQLAAGEAAAFTSKAYDSEAAGVGAGLAVPVVTSLLRRGATPFPKRLEGGAKSVVDIAKAEGIPLTAYQQTGRGSAKVIAPSASVIEDQQLAFNNAVIKKTGHPGSDYYTDDVSEQIKQSYGPKFNNLVDETSKLLVKGKRGISLDSKFANQMNNIYRNFYGRDPLSGKTMPAVDNVIEGVYNRLLSKNPSINGQEYKELRTALGSRATTSNNSEERFALGKLISTLDDQMSRTARKAGKPELAKAWKKARNEYKNYLILENSFRSAKDEANVIGNIDPSRFAGSVNAAKKKGYIGLKDDIYKLGKVSKYISEQDAEDGKLMSLARRYSPISGPVGTGAVIGSLVGAPYIGAALGYGAGKLASTKTGQKFFANQKFAEPVAYGPTMATGVREAIQPDEQPEQKAIGGLASLKKRYG
jgi:uncharacterized protein YcfJ